MARFGGKVHINSLLTRTSLVVASLFAFAAYPLQSTADVRHGFSRSDVELLNTARPVSVDVLASISNANPASVGNVVAGAAPGTQVYRNETLNPAGYRPGSGERMADDLQLASGPTMVKYISLGVAGLELTNSFAFNVNVGLWTGDPCIPGSALIAGTGIDFPSVPNDGTLKLLEATYPTAISVPGTVWMAVNFTGAGANNAAWIVSDQAELGFTGDFFSENNQQPPPAACDIFTLAGSPPRYGGFWATVNAELATPPNGACCAGTNCTQTTQAACTGSSTWQGAFTTCQPNSCLPGACCQGNDFEFCVDTNEVGCSAGNIFRPLETCAAGACGPTFKVFENDFLTAVVIAVPQTQKWADDLTLGPGAPCEVVAYDIVVGGISDPVVNFSVQIELWTNFDNGTPTLESDDVPLAPIAGTLEVISGIPADSFRHTVVATPAQGVILPDKVWIVLTATDPGGPEFGGLADIGASEDAFAIFNHASGPNEWTPGFFFEPGGFDPESCPGPQCFPAGSFRVHVWCAGDAPTGACCGNASGECRDGVVEEECNGRWRENEICELAEFDPPCGIAACCFRFPPNPSFIMCSNMTAQDCEINNGDRNSDGLFCEDTTCPRPACIDSTGDCFSPHAGTGCNEGFCCEEVCSQGSFYAFCCTSEWDNDCALKAQELCAQGNNDDCGDAQAIVGPGTFNFDLRGKTTDGPAHLECLNTNESQIEKDAWYCWQSTCTGSVIVRLCDIGAANQTTIDSKLAVYSGCSCPPTDANLLECNDDRCELQSMVVFDAVAGQNYMIRLGVYPDSEPGTGTFTISCGPPTNQACTTGSGDCCSDRNARACGNANCCNTVCACDPFCCTTEWDENCAGNGFEDSGCGALQVCGHLCRDACPVGAVAFLTPASGAVDARFPHSLTSANPKFGINTFTVSAPQDAEDSCWTVCDTANSGNSITSVTEAAGTYTITLANPIPAGAVTTLTYTATDMTRTRGQFIFHPGNVNAVNTAGTQDVLDLIGALRGSFSLPYGLLSGDIDRSGVTTAIDVLAAIDILSGAGAFQVWNNTPKPSLGQLCP